MKYELDKYKEFLDMIFQKLTEARIDVSGFYLDHIAYRAITNKEYKKVKEEFSKLGTVVSELMIRNRPVGVFKLNKPLIYKGRKINCLEILAPAEGDQFNSGLEHAEFVVKEDLYKFMEKYSHLKFIDKTKNKKHNPEVILRFDNNSGVKFHLLPLLEVIEIEKVTGIL